MAAYEERKAQLEALGTTVYAASVDTLEQTKEVAAHGFTFPIAFGLTREDADLIGAWWQEQRGFVQPSEFILAQSGEVLDCTYASGPVGRMAAEEAVRLITGREQRRLKQAQASS